MTMNDGFFRAAAATPAIRVADCRHNAEAVAKLMEEAAARGVQAVVFPELCLTGYTCGDLFLQKPLRDAAERERAHADSQAAEALAQFDEIMTGLRGRLSHAIETPAEQDPPVPKPHETPAKPAEHPAQPVEKHKPACQGRENPTLAQLLGALRGNK